MTRSRVATEVLTTILTIVLTLAIGATAARGDDGPLVDTSQSPGAQLHGVGLRDVRIDGGLWGDRLDVCRSSMVPNMWRLLDDPRRCHAFANFQIAAGVGHGRDGDHHGPSWHDGDFYKWFEAAARTLAATEDAELDAQLDGIIEVIARAQRDDGYIHTPTIIASLRARDDEDSDGGTEEFRDRLDFETYNLGHLMTTACVHHRATGKTSLLRVARRAADYLHGVWRESPELLARNAICPSHYMGVVELYRETRETRYLDLARGLIEIRDLVADGSDHDQERVPVRAMEEAVGHAVRANYLYAGLADVCAETDDAALLASLGRVWDDVVSKKLYITGATGALYDGASPDGGRKHGAIQLVHQAYGRPYQLPNLTAYNETCASIGLVLWAKRMLAMTGDPSYADVLERSLHNALLASISLDGTRFLYVNPLAREPDLPFELRWSRTRQSYISCFCCPPNTVRTIAEVPDYLYGLSTGALWVHGYAPGRLATTVPDAGRIELRQETEYPWKGDVRFTIEAAPDAPSSIKLRIPPWARGATVRVSGDEAAEQPSPGSYFVIERRWKVGDAIELRLPMRARLVEAHPLVEETRGQVAVVRGPIVYCLESADLPEDASIDDVFLSLDSEFEPRPIDIAGADLVALETKARVRARGEWRPGELYREVERTAPREIDLRLVPYFAWGNRGAGGMRVWLPVR